jgi:PAS domain S-box-containing protein
VELFSRLSANGIGGLQVLRNNDDLVFGRGSRDGAEGRHSGVLVVLPASEQPAPGTLERLTREYSFKDELDSTWAVRPLELVQDRGRAVLVLEDPGGELLSRYIGTPMEIERFLRIAVRVAASLGKMHQRGLIHKDIKPANILVDQAGGEQVRLTGFGTASRLPRERQAPDPPEVIAGTLAYMAPEQTGRMNRSIDSRSDLYSFGVTLYEMLIGSLPFTASDPMEWVHCHIARKPVPPSDRLDTVPAPVSAIVMKLLAKTAEERYQTAAGVERDLRHCLAEWTRGSLADFPPGQEDAPDRLLIPEKLYGREREVETLLASFDRTVKNGAPELVLVSGYSGIGKSSVVSELYPVMVPPRGLFASGKFDQYKRDIPYATLVQAFHSLVRPLLSKSDIELSGWHDALIDALGANGRLITDLVPELELIIGEQPPISELSPQDAQRRFQRVLQRFIGVFARPEHPLALFLDDLQWLDTATLDLIEEVLTRSDLQHLMLIGAYRDNEVSDAHPLRRKLNEIKAAGGKVTEITLGPLGHEHLSQLIADTLRCDPKRAAPLARLIHDKTGGNPFFAIQFLTELAEERLLSFDAAAPVWQWNVDRIRAKNYSGNVVDLVAGKLRRLSAPTQDALKQFACLGSAAETFILILVHGETVHTALREAIHAGLVVQQERAYKFLHDRIQQAAYSLIPGQNTGDVHLRIGRALLTHMTADQLGDHLFDVANQLNRGAALLVDDDEKTRVAAINLRAGQKARASAAYASALTYFAAGRELLPDDGWTRQYRLLFDLEIHRAECEYLTGVFAAAENRLSALAQHATNLVDKAAVARQRISLYTVLDRLDRATDTGLEFLSQVGINWSPHPTSDDVQQEYAEIWQRLGDRSIEQLVDLPSMTDPGCRATVDVLVTFSSPAGFMDSNLNSLILGRIINLSLEHGHTDGSCFAYVYSNLALGACFGDYRSGFRFAKLGFDLMESRKLLRFKPRVYLGFALSNSWVKHLSASHTLLRHTFEAAREAGDVVFMGYALRTLLTNLIASGTPLAETESEAERAIEFARKARFGLVFDIVSGQLALIRTLRGRTPVFGSFNDGEFDEGGFERRLRQDRRLAFAAYLYSVRKLQALYFAGDYLSAIEAEEKAGQLLSHSPSYRLYFDTAEYCFYGALARAACCHSSPADRRSQHFEMLRAHHALLQTWAEDGPENLVNRVALIGAEIARLEGRDADAMRLYEHAIRSARDHGFVQNEAVAHEVASGFYAARGSETSADAHLRKARDCYLRWGAGGKVRQLDRLYPYLAAPEGQPSAAAVDSAIQQLDVASVVKASQALSGEIMLQKLIERLMTIAIENAGADRGLLILPAGNEYLVRAEARATGDQIEVMTRHEPITPSACPESLIRYVIRTQESVILDDASKPNLFSADGYLRDRQSKSILCLPLVKQRELIGVLLLENALTSHAFTPGRIAILELLAAQAAISLENMGLYSDLQEREAKIRRLVDSNIIGILTVDLDGQIIEANDAFLRMVGYEREDLVAGRLHWTNSPSEWREDDPQRVERVKTTGTLQAFEKEYFRKDGSRVSALVGVARIEETKNEAVAFVIDLTERKQAEAALREAERQNLDAQMQLAHANRIATMGQLAASIAHEVSQPIAAMLLNAGTALRWLGASPPNLSSATRTIESIIADGKRAADIVGRIRDLAKKAPARKQGVNINEIVLEVIALIRGEMSDNGVLPNIQLSEGLPPILGDRVRLQQVILNLIMNALEAMSEVRERARELLISTGEAETEGVLVTVRDSGPGLPQADPERVFEAFYTTKASGLGMGLSICRTIVEAHGGRLWATPNKPNGAAFCMMLPIEKSSIEEADSPQAQTH